MIRSEAPSVGEGAHFVGRDGLYYGSKKAPTRHRPGRRPPAFASLERIERGVRFLRQAGADQSIGCNQPVPKLILGCAPGQVHP